MLGSVISWIECCIFALVFRRLLKGAFRLQLLWVNLIMDTLGALALATEPPTDDLMEKTPVGRKEPLITNIMWRNLFGQVSVNMSSFFFCTWVILPQLMYIGRAIL